MAEFKTTYEKYIKPNEGGYVLDPDDKGGETYAGIARKFNPQWSGWGYIDAQKKQGVIKKNTLFSSLDGEVEQFYLDLWNKNKFSEIRNQSIADIFFDFVVNSGVSAIKAVQKIVGTSADGIIGPNTIKAINTFYGPVLFDKILAYRKAFYNAIIERDPTQEKFQKGWFSRLDRFGRIAIVSLPVLIGAVLVLLLLNK